MGARVTIPDRVIFCRVTPDTSGGTRKTVRALLNATQLAAVAEGAQQIVLQITVRPPSSSVELTDTATLTNRTNDIRTVSAGLSFDVPATAGLDGLFLRMASGAADQNVDLDILVASPGA